MIKTLGLKFFDVRRSPIVKLLFSAIKNRFVLISLLALAAVGVWLASWAFWYEPSSLTVKHYDVKIPELNPAFDDFKIVAISDVHGGANFITEEKIRQVVALANKENADLIVLLGDFVSQQFFDRRQLKMPMATIADNLRGLQARHGVFAVTGNHDLWHGEQKVRAELERVGYRVLISETAQIERDGQILTLLGLPEVLKYNSWKRYSTDARDALAKNENLGDVIALVHSPDAFSMLDDEIRYAPELRLMLAGHTHGGQCNFPVVGAPISSLSFEQKFVKGLFNERGKLIFVTPGIGTSILPVRFRVPPEISVLTLKKTMNDER